MTICCLRCQPLSNIGEVSPLHPALLLIVVWLGRGFIAESEPVQVLLQKYGQPSERGCQLFDRRERHRKRDCSKVDIGGKGTLAAAGNSSLDKLGLLIPGAAQGDIERRLALAVASQLCEEGL